MDVKYAKQFFHYLKRQMWSSEQNELALGEKGADFYDQAIDESRRVHYTASPYYFLWTVIVDRIRRASKKAILEVGCGTGQLAYAIYDTGIIKSYRGFDFSGERIKQARRNCPVYQFDVEDVFQTSLFESYDYDIVIATEFLEHIEQDLQVMSFIKSGAHFIGTVPNFPYVSHVRHFHNCEEVTRRYLQFFTDFKVDAFKANELGKTFFLLEGIKV